MAINLEKGQRVAVELPKFTVGLGWDENNSNTGCNFDLDASAFILGENGKIPADEYFVFYNNLVSPDGAVEHTGDNQDGSGSGDDESINIDLSKIDPRAAEIVFVVTIHKCEERRQNFGQVRNAFIRIGGDSCRVRPPLQAWRPVEIRGYRHRHEGRTGRISE